jgi:hypothetical protein
VHLPHLAGVIHQPHPQNAIPRPTSVPRRRSAKHLQFHPRNSSHTLSAHPPLPQGFPIASPFSRARAPASDLAVLVDTAILWVSAFVSARPCHISRNQDVGHRKHACKHWGLRSAETSYPSDDVKVRGIDFTFSVLSSSILPTTATQPPPP